MTSQSPLMRWRHRGCVFQPWQPARPSTWHGAQEAVQCRQQYCKQRDPHVMAFLMGPAMCALVREAVGEGAFLFNEQVRCLAPS